MRKFLSRMVCATTALCTLLFITCKLPTDPAADPNNLNAEIFIEEPGTGVVQGQPVTFGIKVTYPAHAQSINVGFGQNIPDATINVTEPTSVNQKTYYVTCTYPEAGNMTLNVNVKLSVGTIKPFTYQFKIFEKALSVSLSLLSQQRLFQVNKTDTLHLSAATDPAGGGIEFSAVSTPALDKDHLFLIDDGSTARVIINPDQNGSYQLTLNAQSGNAKNSLTANFKTYLAPVITQSSGKTVITAGAIDTILLSIPGYSGATSNVKLLNVVPYDSSAILLVPSRQDTLKIQVKPLEEKTYTFTVLFTTDSLSDTITFQKIVTGAPVSTWKQASAIVNANEGKQLSYSFSSHLTDSTRTDMTFSSSKGTIDNKVVRYPVHWGSSPKDSLLISATANGTVSEFKLILNVASADSSKPKLTLVAPATNVFKTNDTKITCKIVAIDSGAGIGSVTFTKDGIVITDTTRNDSLYMCNIANLANNASVIVKMVVTDASMKKNKDSISITITRDSTMEDKSAPTFTIISDPRKNGRVTVDTGTIKVSIEDGSGIADNSVIAKLNGTTITGITKSGDIYSIPYSLKAYGQSTIIIKATDNSTSKNSDSITLNIDYNTTITVITAETPKLDSTKVVLQPTFSWSGGDDADKDTVYYKVLYGTDSSALISQTAIVTQKSVTIATALSANTKYFWKVIGYTMKYPDTAQSPIMRFTTLNNDNSGPIITFKSGTSNGSRVKVSSGEIVVTIKDPNGIQSQGVSATLNGTILTGLTSSGDDYTIPYTLTTFQNNTIVISAKDNSPDHNGTTLTIAFTYNTEPTVLVLISPTDGAQEIDTLPTFKWSGGKDADGDSVFFKVQYGTTTAFGNQTAEFFNVDSIRLTTKLPANSVQYWKVIGYTKGNFKDTVVLGPYSFKTVNPDRTTPVITLTAPASYVSGMRVTTATGTISFTATDANGIDSVYYQINSGVKTALTASASQYSFIYNFTTFGVNTIKLLAIDKSAERNKDSITLTFTYNTIPSAVTLQTPADAATNIDTLPSFTWTGGDDADSDPVSYRVLYGTSATTLTSPSAVVNVKTVTLTSKLTTNQTYYWKVIAYTSGTFKDTVPSGTYSFTTVNPDRTKPILTVTAPAPYTERMRVTSATNNITFTASDANGIDSAYYTVNATGTKTAVTGTGGTYSFSYTLTRRGLDTIHISVVDGSAQHNKTSTQVIVTYNSLLPENITVTAPENNKTDVPLLPTFTWTALSDADGDAVSYRVKYSTSSSLPSGSSMTSAITGTTITLANALITNTPYYYQVIGYTSLPFADTARSDIRLFTTVPPVPTITTHPSDRSVVVGSSATFTVAATGTGLTYQWRKRTTDIEGATSSSYTTETTTSLDNGAQFRCVISNAGGSVTSNAATLTIQYAVSYNGNNNTSGTVPPVANYEEGATVTVAPGVNRTNYTFGGWSNGVTTYSAGQTFGMGTSNVSLTAIWTAVPTYTVSFNFNADTGVTSSQPSDITVPSGGSAGSLPPNPERLGYVFESWNLNTSGTGRQFTASTIINTNLQVYAKWVIRDPSGNEYEAVKINGKTWMTKNYKSTKYTTGNAITLWSDGAQNAPKCFIGDGNCGVFYNGFVIQRADFAPEGWHVPTPSEFQLLARTPSSFEASFCGYIDYNASPINFGTWGIWGSNDVWMEEGTTYWTTYYITNTTYILDSDDGRGIYGVPIRLVRDY